MIMRKQETTLIFSLHQKNQTYGYWSLMKSLGKKITFKSTYNCIPFHHMITTYSIAKEFELSTWSVNRNWNWICSYDWSQSFPKSFLSSSFYFVVYICRVFCIFVHHFKANRNNFNRGLYFDLNIFKYRSEWKCFNLL